MSDQRAPERRLPEPITFHRAQAGESCIATSELIEWLLRNDPADLPHAIARGIAQMMLRELRSGGQVVISPAFEPGMRRGEGVIYVPEG